MTKKTTPGYVEHTPYVKLGADLTPPQKIQTPPSRAASPATKQITGYEGHRIDKEHNPDIHHVCRQRCHCRCSSHHRIRQEQHARRRGRRRKICYKLLMRWLMRAALASRYPWLCLFEVTSTGMRPSTLIPRALSHSILNGLLVISWTLWECQRDGGRNANARGRGDSCNRKKQVVSPFKEVRQVYMSAVVQFVDHTWYTKCIISVPIAPTPMQMDQKVRGGSFERAVVY